MAKHTTLTDIAKAAGVTPMTVQRALKGADGVGEERRRQIRQIADEMNYKPNALASVLKRGRLKIAAVLPDGENENRYYASCLWAGLEMFLEKNTIFQIECCKITYDRSPENQGLALERMLLEHGEDLDGVITMGESHPDVLKALAVLDERKIPYVFVGTDYSECGRLCCVLGDNDVAGRLAADLFLNFMKPDEAGRILITGDFSIQDQEINAVGFEKEIRRQRSGMELLKLSNLGDIETTSRLIGKFLNADIDVAGIYSCSARNTLAMCRAVGMTERFVPAVGSDIFAENIELLKTGKLQAIIHKRHDEQTYRAVQILTEYLVEHQEPVNAVEYVVPVVVMNGNVDCYLGDAGRQSGYIL